jgi:phage baseplate assembly protein W|tara:strand:+ start:409 stop:810 length:402 start_codon:yes stop_codon:yes gene_type:complete
MSKLEGFSVKLPLVYSNLDGPYALTKTFKEVAQQDFKNLVLTSPGERIMIPEFGVGLHRLLFEQINDELYGVISTRIYEQTAEYLPFINIEEVNFFKNEDHPSVALNEIQVQILYNILPINEEDVLTITSSTD